VGVIFSAPVPDWARWPTSLLYEGTLAFVRVKRLGRGVDHPPLPNAEVKERVELYLYSPSGPSWPVLGLTLLSELIAFTGIQEITIPPSLTL